MACPECKVCCPALRSRAACGPHSAPVPYLKRLAAGSQLAAEYCTTHRRKPFRAFHVPRLSRRLRREPRDPACEQARTNRARAAHDAHEQRIFKQARDPRILTGSMADPLRPGARRVQAFSSAMARQEHADHLQPHSALHSGSERRAPCHPRHCGQLPSQGKLRCRTGLQRLYGGYLERAMHSDRLL